VSAIEKEIVVKRREENIDRNSVKWEEIMTVQCYSNFKCVSKHVI
jgi:hypothetical protein